MTLFLRKFLSHPGTWSFFALFAIGIAILTPVSAPAWVLVSAIAIGFAAITSIFHFLKIKEKVLDSPGTSLGHWVKYHPAQALIMLLGLGLFITALVLTVGFATGGAGFAFMGPFFGTIMAPFAAAAASAGIQLNLVALAGFTVVLASLCIPNTLKRLAAWIDSFQHDNLFRTYNPDDKNELLANPNMNLKAWERVRGNMQTLEKEGRGIRDYAEAITGGMGRVLSNGLSSEAAELDERVAESKKGGKYLSL